MRLIIDTDTAGDDAFSILLALRHPDVSLEAVTVCNGNVAFDQQVENALYTLEIGGQGGGVPVYPGCARPLLRKPLDATYVFGKDGFSDANYPKAAQRPEGQHAVDAIIERVMAAPGEIDIVAQAPLTNIAAAVTREPRLAQAVRHLWIMGGTDNSIGNVTSAAEFNFYVDPEAARIVLGAGFNVSIVTWTLTVSSSSLSAQGTARIDATDSDITRFVRQVSKAGRAFAKARGRQPFHPDTLTCACAINSSIVTDAAMCVVDIETEGRLTRGYSSVSSPILPDPTEADPDLGALAQANARVIKQVDREAFEKMVLDCFDV